MTIAIRPAYLSVGLILGSMALTLACASQAMAATSAPDPSAQGMRRAILVGINRYQDATPTELEAAKADLIAQHMLKDGERPPERDWSNRILEGAVNDLNSMRELLLHRFGFSRENIIELPDAKATRQNILKALNETFITNARDGDVLLFFYSGHGSQMRNSKSATKGDQVDETIVPWNASVGYYDIRDKELARIFNHALSAHHVTLTAIFDSCHSGSITRGLARLPGKSLPEDTRDAADAYDGGSADSHGALVLSAAQYDEEAEEATDTTITPEIQRGAFAMSLMQVMQTVSPATPASEVFRAARSRLHTLGSQYTQEPVISGPPGRLERGLFGDAPGADGALSVNVISKDETSHTVTIDAGSLVGISQGARFRSIASPAVEVEVASVTGLSQAQATVTSGEFSALHENATLQMTMWAYPANASLTAWVPAANLTVDQLDQAAQLLMPFTKAPFHWVIDPSLEVPTHLVTWSGTQWQLRSPGGIVDVTTPAGLPDVERLSAQLTADSRLLVLFPPPKDWVSTLDQLPPMIAFTAASDNATYWLTGALHKGKLEYAWTQPNAAVAPASALTLPARTDWIPITDSDAAEHLQRYIGQLGRVAAFLKLPESNTATPFSYHLVLQQVGSSNEIAGTDTLASGQAGNRAQRHVKTAEVTGGELYDLVLKADASFDPFDVTHRWVYIFSVDSSARLTRFYKATDDRIRFPRESPLLFARDSGVCTAKHYPTEQPFDEVCVDTIRICPPYGADTYFLLVTSSPIIETSILSGEGVRTGVSERSATNPLAAMLQRIEGGTRGTVVAPEEFSVERLTVLSAGTSKVPACKN